MDEPVDQADPLRFLHDRIVEMRDEICSLESL